MSEKSVKKEEGGTSMLRGVARHSNNFNLIRILAATQVMLFHAAYHLHIALPSWLQSIGKMFPGVPIFFALSGFVISAAFERNGNLKTYARNRALRIFPGLWVVIFLTFVVVAFFKGSILLDYRGLIWFILQFVGLIYTPDALKDFGFGSYNGSLWTIPLELQFYVVLPVIYYFTKDRPRRNLWFIAVFVISLAMALFTARVGEEGETMPQKLLRYSFVPHIYLFLFGVLLQRLDAINHSMVRGKWVLWLFVYSVAYWVLPRTAHTWVLISPLLAVFIVSIAHARPGLSNKVLGDNDWSYGVYIYHGLILNVLIELGLSDHPFRLAFLFLGAYVAAFLSWKIIEKPSLSKKSI